MMKEKIFKTLKEHEEYVRAYYPTTTILGTFLYGSQNYQVDTPESDVDTITILIPSFEDLVFGEYVSKELVMPAGTHEHCIVKDIREIVKQWKKPTTIYNNLRGINKVYKYGFIDEEIYMVANTRLGWYRRCGQRTINYILNADLLSLPNKKRNRPGLVNPLLYYLR